MLDTSRTSGLFVLNDDVFDEVSKGEHFQLFVPLTLAVEHEMGDAILFTLFDLLLLEPWGPLALMGQDALWWAAPRGPLPRTPEALARRASQRLEFLRAVVRWWPTYLAEGDRYTRLDPQGSPLWGLATTLSFELARRKVTREELQSPLPNGDLRGFLAAHPGGFDGVLS
jgi:hypothetical protein